MIYQRIHSSGGARHLSYLITSGIRLYLMSTKFNLFTIFIPTPYSTLVKKMVKGQFNEATSQETRISVGKLWPPTYKTAKNRSASSASLFGAAQVPNNKPTLLGLEYADFIPWRGVRLLYQKKKRGVLLWHSIISNGEAPVLEILREGSIASLPLLPGPLWLGMVVPVRVPSMGQINLFKNDSYSTEILNTI